MGGVVVNDDHHTGRLGGLYHLLIRSGFLQEFTQPTSFTPKSWVCGRLKQDALAADAEQKLIVSMRLDLTRMFDKFDGLAPTQVMGQPAAEKILVSRL